MDRSTPKKRKKRSRYSVRCVCGNEMRVRPRHIGRMCRCTQCNDPIYVTFDNVRPKLNPYDKKLPRMFAENDVPVYWKKGDLLMELYEVREELEEGGMATVYRIRHRGWDTDVAVKFPRPELVPDEGWMETFERECATWVDLPPHPNVVECFYVRRLGNIPRVFMEYVPSDNLSRLIRRHTFYTRDQAINLPRMLDVLIQFARGIEHAHACGVIHHDIKPPNVLVTRDFDVKVTDFGLAQVTPGMEDTTGGTPATQSHRRPKGGTPVYRAPEQASHKEALFQTDMWGWALSALELFAGGVFWREGPTGPKALADYRREGSDFEFIPPMPAALDDILETCLNEEPSDRPESMSDIVNALVTIYEDEVGEAYPRPQPEELSHSFEARNNRAVSFLDLGMYHRSERLWKELHDEAPEYFPAEYNRQLYLWRAGGLTDAQIVEHLRESADQAPTDAQRQYLLARVLLERGDVVAALELLNPLYKSGEGGRDVAYAFAMAQSLEPRDRHRVESINPGVIPNALHLSNSAREAFIAMDDGQIGRLVREPTRSAAVIGRHPQPATALAMPEDESFVFSTSADGNIAVWDFDRPKPRFAKKGHSKGINALAVSVTGRHGVTAGRDGRIRLWELRRGTLVRTIDAHDSEATAASFSRCGAYLFSGSESGQVRMWDTWSGEQLVAASFDKQGRIAGIRFDHDRGTAVVAAGSFVVQWEFRRDLPPRIFKAHQERIESFSVTPDLRYALTAIPKSTSKLWELSTRQCLRSLKIGAPATLTPDGKFLAGLNRRGQLEYWAVHLDSPPFHAPFLVSQRSPEQDKDED